MTLRLISFIAFTLFISCNNSAQTTQKVVNTQTTKAKTVVTTTTSQTVPTTVKSKTVPTSTKAKTVSKTTTKKPVSKTTPSKSVSGQGVTGQGVSGTPTTIKPATTGKSTTVKETSGSPLKTSPTSSSPTGNNTGTVGNGKPNAGTGTSTGTNNTGSNTGTTTSTGTVGNGKPTAGNGTGTTSNTGNGNVITDVITGAGDITQGDAASAIKEALMKGVTAGVEKVAVTNGYFGNSMIKIPFPKDVQVVETTLRSLGMGSMIDNLIVSLNRAAEGAAKQAAPIFINGIKQMTVTDAINIVSNQQPDAATQFLQRTTGESLVTSFKPSIKTALDKSLATKYWADITGYYNKIPFVQKVNTDMPDFVTRKAITGLFYMVGQEEAKIRKDPAGQASTVIDKVFGAFKK